MGSLPQPVPRIPSSKGEKKMNFGGLHNRYKEKAMPRSVLYIPVEMLDKKEQFIDIPVEVATNITSSAPNVTAGTASITTYHLNPANMTYAIKNPMYEKPRFVRIKKMFLAIWNVFKDHTIVVYFTRRNKDEIDSIPGKRSQYYDETMIDPLETKFKKLEEEVSNRKKMQDKVDIKNNGSVINKLEHDIYYPGTPSTALFPGQIHLNSSNDDQEAIYTAKARREMNNQQVNNDKPTENDSALGHYNEAYGSGIYGSKINTGDDTDEA